MNNNPHPTPINHHLTQCFLIEKLKGEQCEGFFIKSFIKVSIILIDGQIESSHLNLYI